VILGFTTAYPVNVWMVARNMKHGLMTRRPADRAQRPASHAHGERRMRWDVTRPQLTAVATLTTLALVSSTVLSTQKVNVSLGANDVGGAMKEEHS
jgi:hypothetical protein